MRLLLFLVVWLQTLIVFKPNNEFEVKIDLRFKQKESDNSPTNKVSVDYTETVEQHNRKLTGTQLPFLGLKIKFLTLSQNESRVKIVDNFGKVSYSKKADLETVIKLDAGYLDDIKDGVSPNAYDVILLDSDKIEVDRITIIILKDGTFLVNNEKRGKF